MGKARRATGAENGTGAGGAAALTAAVSASVSPETLTSPEGATEALHRLAAELGSMLARSLSRPRRGFSLVELLAGLLFCSVLMVSIARRLNVW